MGSGSSQKSDEVRFALEVIEGGDVFELVLGGRLLILLPSGRGEGADEGEAVVVVEEEALVFAVIGFVSEEEDVAEHDDAGDEPVEHKDSEHFLLVLAVVAHLLHEAEVGFGLFVVEDQFVNFAGLRRYHRHLGG